MSKYILTALLFLTAIAAGCTQASQGSNSGAVEGPGGPQVHADGPAAPEFAPTADASADLEKLNERVLAARSLKAKMTLDGPTPIVTELDFEAPDRYHLRSTGTLEMLYVGRATLMKVGDEWKMMALPTDPKITEIRGAFTSGGMKGTSNLKYTGDETVNGRAAYLYTFNGRAPRAGIENESKLWVAKNTGMPLRLETSYRSGAIGTTTIDFDFETPVKIELPAQARRAVPGYQK